MRPGGEALVVGAGLGGLAVARALARRGVCVHVLERAPRIAEVGAGIQIGPNGLAVLDALGLGERVRARAVRAEAVELRDGPSGRLVLRLDLARHGRGRTWLLIHRARMIEVLEEGVRELGIPVELGAEVGAVADGSDGARLDVGGVERSARLVIGADGVGSRVRQALEGAATPAFAGHVAWRAIVPGDAPPQATVHMGPGRHLVTYPLAGGLINVVAVEERRAWTAESWSATDDPERLRAAFAGFAPEVRQLLAKVGQVNVWGLFRHPVASRWHGCHVALLGDAAHPALPFLAQGANLALEDAWALAECWCASSSEAGLAAYQARRRARASRVVDAATANARNYHLRSAPVRAAAHAGLRALGTVAPSLAVRRFDWIYDHDETSGRG